MKKLFFIFLIPLLFLVFVIIYTKHQQPSAIIDNHTFDIEIARTQTEQEIGLSKYTHLPQNNAMYFPFTKPDYYTFWMKGMRFPIDIIFIRNKRIVTIYNSVPYPKNNETNLPTYKGLADSVLEINAGLARKYGFKAGDSVIISY